MSPHDILDVPGGAPIKLWTRGVPVEDEARHQLMNTAKLPFIFKHLAVMPDVHLGKGSTIGSVIPTVGAIIPAAGPDGKTFWRRDTGIAISPCMYLPVEFTTHCYHSKR